METTETQNVQPTPLTSDERREFLQRASRYAVAAPAAALLLQAASKPAMASTYEIISTTLNVPSDRRLKADVVREGTLANGIALYSYRYAWSAQRFVGVMADEVEAVMPAAVSRHRSGYKMVNYAMVLG